MGHDGAEGQRRAQGEKQRQLIHVLDHNIGSLGSNRTANGSAAPEREAGPPPNTLDADATVIGTGRGSLPTGTDQSYPVPPAGESAEDLEQVDLGPARGRIGQVLPIDEE